jgi:predicted phosphodiesterase
LNQHQTAENSSAQPAAFAGEATQTLLDSPPVLQNPSPHGVTVTWVVRAPATGWVEYGTTPELGRRADATMYGQKPVSARFFRVSLTGLEPGQTVYYRVVVAPVRLETDINISHRGYCSESGQAVAGPIYRWTTLNTQAGRATFAVINDTHEQPEVLRALMDELAVEPVEMTIRNGDLCNVIDSEEQIVTQVLRPVETAYAAQHPVLFTSGNHDFRGEYSRALSQALSPWESESPLGRCFAVRQGPLALIGLDTGEDKPDRHPVFAGLASFEPYREAQREWLAAALQRREIATAPYLVVLCHIPLWGLPGHNPGDTLEGYALYCRHAQQLWHPLLEEAGAQLLICGHTHNFRYDAPTAERRYGQIVGGGPTLEKATLVRGHADAARLEVVATDLKRNELGRWCFAPRVAAKNTKSAET